MKKRIIMTVMICMAVMFMSCTRKTNNESDDIKYFGPEIYNACYVAIPNETVTVAIPVMSKIDLSGNTGFDVDVTGGTCDMKKDIEIYDYELDGYKYYKVVLELDNIKFEEEKVKINTIKLYFDDKSCVEIKPDKCEFVQQKGEYNVEHIDINGSPLRMPADMTRIPLELSTAEREVKVTNVILTNKALMMANYRLEGESEKFEPFMLSASTGDVVTWEADFGIENTELTTYKQYGTSIIVEYEYEGNAFYTVPGVPATIYNPFDPGYDGIETYYNDIIKK